MANMICLSFAEPERPSHSSSSSARPPPADKASSPRTDSQRYSSGPPPPGKVQNLRDDSASARKQSPPQSYDSRPPPGAYDSRRDDRRYASGGSGSRQNSYEGSGHGRDQRGERYDSRNEGRYDDRYASGPPPGRGDSQRMSQGHSTRPPHDGSDRDAMWQMFRAVDRGQTGQLREEELGRALVNGDYTSFDPHTVRMMIRFVQVLVTYIHACSQIIECSTLIAQAPSLSTSSGKLLMSVQVVRLDALY